jgi:uncharacterized protein YbjT (DUF2867 family)
MILVTGATGTIGSATVEALKSRGAKFKVGVRSAEKAKQLGAESTHFDFDDFNSYLPALQGVEKVFLLPPISASSLGYTLQLVAAAKRAGVKHLVKLSVIGADSDPGISLTRQHFAGERELRASGLAWTMLRPTFFMQNFVNYYGVDPKKDGPVYLAHAEGRTTWVDARDVAEVAAAVLTTEGHEGKVYDLTGPAAVSSAEALAMLGQALGHKYDYMNVPPEAADKALADMGAPLWMVDGFGELSWLIRNGYASAVAPGVTQVLGREPRTFESWARDFASKVK